MATGVTWQVTDWLKVDIAITLVLLYASGEDHHGNEIHLTLIKLRINTNQESSQWYFRARFHLRFELMYTC